MEKYNKESSSVSYIKFAIVASMLLIAVVVSIILLQMNGPMSDAIDYNAAMYTEKTSKILTKGSEHTSIGEHKLPPKYEEATDNVNIEASKVYYNTDIKEYDYSAKQVDLYTSFKNNGEYHIVATDMSHTYGDRYTLHDIHSTGVFRGQNIDFFAREGVLTGKDSIDLVGDVSCKFGTYDFHAQKFKVDFEKQNIYANEDIRATSEHAIFFSNELHANDDTQTIVLTGNVRSTMFFK